MASENLTIGRGELWFAPFKTGTQTPDGYFFVGNCPSISLNREADLLPHYSSTRGFRRKDEEITIEARLNGSFEVDDVRAETLALFFMGTALTLTSSSATGTQYVIMGVKKGRTYQIGESASAPSGVRKIASPVVVDHDTPATTFVAGTDYTIDNDLGLITILSTGAITDGTDVRVTYNQTVASRDIVIASDAETQGAMKYVAYNPIGKNFDYTFPWVKVRPNGDLGLITEEWMTVPLSVEALYKGDLALCYLDGRPVTA